MISLNLSFRRETLKNKCGFDNLLPSTATAKEVDKSLENVIAEIWSGLVFFTLAIDSDFQWVPGAAVLGGEGLQPNNTI